MDIDDLYAYGITSTSDLSTENEPYKLPDVELTPLSPSESIKDYGTGPFTGIKQEIVKEATPSTAIYDTPKIVRVRNYRLYKQKG